MTFGPWPRSDGALHRPPTSQLYRPNLGFTGNDSFVYQVTEGPVSDLATVNIGIVAAPGNCEINGRSVGCAPN